MKWVQFTMEWILMVYLDSNGSVTVGNSPAAPGTLGIYQPLNWVKNLAGLRTCAGVTNNREEPLYHLQHLLRLSHIMVHYSILVTLTIHH